MKLVNLKNNNEKESFSKKLTKSLASSNVNILLGSGFSRPLLSVLGSIEERLTLAKQKDDKIEIFEIEKEFFDTAGAFSQIPLYKRLSMADPVKVVRKAIRDSAAGRSVSVYGPLMKLFSFFAKLLPHSLILKGWEALDMRAAAQNTAPPQE